MTGLQEVVLGFVYLPLTVRINPITIDFYIAMIGVSIIAAVVIWQIVREILGFIFFVVEAL